MAAVLLAGCGSDAPPQAPPTPAATATPAPTPPPGCDPLKVDGHRRSLLDWLGSPRPSADPGPTARIESVGPASRWTIGEAELVWMAPVDGAPQELHVVFGEDGALGPAVVEAGHALLWLPPPPRRPETSQRLLERARRPPRRYALSHGQAALTAARIGRFGPSPTGRTVVHAGGDWLSAAHLAALDPRVDAFVSYEDVRTLFEERVLQTASCKGDVAPILSRAVPPISPPQPATAPLPSPEPAPWTVALSNVHQLPASPPPVRGWIVFGEAPEGFAAPHESGGEGHEWDWGHGDDLEIRPPVARRLGVEAAEIGFLGVGANGLHALRYALANEAVGVAIATPLTFWTDEAAAPAWPLWAMEKARGAGTDPWWLMKRLGDRAIVVDPRDALGRPWTGPPPIGQVAPDLATALKTAGSTQPR